MGTSTGRSRTKDGITGSLWVGFKEHIPQISANTPPDSVLTSCPAAKEKSERKDMSLMSL